MKLSQTISINAILSMAIGIAFGIYAPLIMAFFGIPDIPSDDVLLYWYVASFVRMYGAALFGYGILLLALRKVATDLPGDYARGILFAIVFANIAGLFSSIVQQAAIWQSTAGWVLTAFYAIFLVIYVYFLIKENRSQTS